MLIARQGQLYTPWCMIRTTVLATNESKQQPSSVETRTQKHIGVELKVQREGFSLPLCTK